VGQSYVPIDFVVLKTGGDERAPIILGRPFLSTMKTIIYADTAKIYFTIKDKKEKTPLRSISPSRIRRRSSHSKIVYYILLLIHKRHTRSKRQQKWPRIRKIEEGGSTRPASHPRRLST
jgi:hypothetical protein